MRIPLKTFIAMLAFSLMTGPFPLVLSAGEETAPADSPAATDISQLALPESLGKVENRFQGEGGRWIIHIQDVHAHLGAQENISAIIDHLQSAYGINTIALEGGWSQTSFAQSWGLPPSNAKRQMVRALLEQDFITGPAYSALSSPLPIKLVGMEDEEVYKQNLEVFRKNLAARKEIEELIKVTEENLQAKKTSAYSTEQLGFDKALTEFREGKKAEKFLPSLMQLTSEASVDLSDLAQVGLFQQMLAMEKDIDKEKLKSEAGRLESAFKSKRLNFEELLRNNVVPAEKLEFYPEAKKFLELIRLRDRLDTRQFFSELEEAIGRYKKTVFTEPEAEALDQKWERFILSKRVLTLSASPDDVKTLEAAREKFEEELTEAGLKDALDIAMEFYDLARKRDQVFFEKITADKRLSGNIAIVTGGFHTDSLDAKFRDAGISHMVLTPDLADTQPDQELYFKRVQDNFFSPVQTQTLDEHQNVFLNKLFDQLLFYAVREVAKTQPLNIKVGIDIIEAGVFKGEIPKGLESAAPKEKIKAENFMEMSAAEQRKWVRRWLKEWRQSKVRIVLAFKLSKLRDMLADPETESVLNNVVGKESTNTLAILQDVKDFLPLVGYKARISRLQDAEGNEQIELVLEQRFPEEFKRKRVAAFVKKAARGKALFLPTDFTENEKENLRYLRAMLFLVRPILERELTPSLNEAFLKRVDEILSEILAKKGLLETAA